MFNLAAETNTLQRMNPFQERIYLSNSNSRSHLKLEVVAVLNHTRFISPGLHLGPNPVRPVTRHDQNREFHPHTAFLWWHGSDPHREACECPCSSMVVASAKQASPFNCNHPVHLRAHRSARIDMRRRQGMRDEVHRTPLCHGEYLLWKDLMEHSLLSPQCTRFGCSWLHPKKFSSSVRIRLSLYLRLWMSQLICPPWLLQQQLSHTPGRGKLGVVSIPF